jgi:hypothetical protein
MGDGEMPDEVPGRSVTDEVPEEVVEDREDDTPPRILEVIGQVGVYIATASLVSTAFGIVAIALGIQPYGNIATTLALVGVTVAMIMGMLFQAYVGDLAAASGRQ